MRARNLLCSLLAFGSVTACGAGTEPAAVPTMETSARAAASAPAPAAPAGEVIAAPATTAAPSAGSPARGADALAKLPRGAAIYFNVRPEEIAAFGDVTGGLGGDLRQQLQRTLGGRPPEDLFNDVGLDGRGSLLAAVVSPAEKSARAVIDAVVAGVSGTALDKLVADHQGDTIRVRLLLPLRPGTDPSRAAGVLAKAFIGAGSVDTCPGAASCAAFGAETPLRVVHNPLAAATIYADGGDLRVDLLMPIFGPGPDQTMVQGLATFRDLRGGPQGRCTQHDPDAGLSLCIDGPLAGELGATTGYGKVVQALAGASIDPKQMKALAGAGREESQRNLTLASPSRKIANDGTLTLQNKGDDVNARVSWALTDAARPSLEKAFATERCATGKAFKTDLLPALVKAVGDPGKELADLKKVYEAFREAGWGAYPVALSGTWLNLLGLVTQMKTKVMEIPDSVQVCLRTEGGRLKMAVTSGP